MTHLGQVRNIDANLGDLANVANLGNIIFVDENNQVISPSTDMAQWQLHHSETVQEEPFLQRNYSATANSEGIHNRGHDKVLDF